MRKHYVSEMCPDCGHTGDYHVDYDTHVVSCEMCGKPMLLCSLCDMDAVDCGACPWWDDLVAFDEKGDKKMKHVSYDTHVEKMEEALTEYLKERDDERWDCGYDCGISDALATIERLIKVAPARISDGDLLDIILDTIQSKRDKAYEEFCKTVSLFEAEERVNQSIEAGDEVKFGGDKYIVLEVYRDEDDKPVQVTLMDWSGQTRTPSDIQDVTRTGKTYPEFNSLLNQLWESNK